MSLIVSYHPSLRSVHSYSQRNPVYYVIWQKPVAVPPWNESQEGADNADWAQDFINIYKPERPILSGGGYAVPITLQPGWPNTNYLIAEAYNETIKKYTKFYNGHLYALSNSTILAEEMAHSKTVADLSHFEDKIALAHSDGRPDILGDYLHFGHLRLLY